MPPFKTLGRLADFEKVKGGRYLKEILILNSFSFEEKDSRFKRLKPGLALRLLSKELFYISAMVKHKFIVHITHWLHKKDNKSAVNAKCLFYAIEIKEVHYSSHPQMLKTNISYFCSTLL